MVDDGLCDGWQRSAMVSTERGFTVVYGFGLWLWSQVMDLWAEFDLQWGWLWVPMEWWVYYKFFGFKFC